MPVSLKCRSESLLTRRNYQECGGPSANQTLHDKAARTMARLNASAPTSEEGSRVGCFLLFPGFKPMSWVRCASQREDGLM